ncbi:MAG: rod shape-determining protein MreC [Proteobacteria bacterium]|nr:rod shape-determining protein MreC [Pseudomonadota bacterium]MBU1234985.1 rod shape-determining protein MreC [Pseudomonadota bacterium]MBU1417606.1 rod shape-determining protein MreC [Pseudomonadota bacterium]MBU1454757.1 rod shape-determining protein MreC [Pseudomonadota bacterium]
MRNKTSDRKKTQGFVFFRLFLLFFLFVILVLILLGSTIGGRFGVFHQLSLEALGPAQSFFTQLSLSGARFKDKYIALWKVQEENEQLRLELDTYHALLDEYREAYSLNRYLQSELEFKKRENFPALMARVVGKDPSFWFQTLIVDRGSNDGVVVGMVARTSRGVVGQVVQVASNYSKILLANAPSSAIDAIVQKSRVRGILKGAGEEGYVLHYVLKNADVSVGDSIVTAGIGGVFPSGITLGTVSRVHSNRRGMFLEIEVKPAVDFARLESLFINLSEEQLIIDEMSRSSVSQGE